jgi:preprotein translocase subunit SecY
VDLFQVSVQESQLLNILFGATQNFPFGGTAILIVVGVGLDTAKQIESQLQQRSYEGFLH